MFFSVSIPIFNAEKYLDRCISSVINQTETDYELILVNDGSTDQSLTICSDWKRRYPDRIRLINKENSGSLYTRRRCLLESRGKYIYIMDSDDCLSDPNALKDIKNTILKTNCDILLFSFRYENGEEKHLPLADGIVYEGKELEEIYRIFLLTHVLNPLWNKVFSRDLVDWDADYSNLDHVTNGTDLYQCIPIISAAKRIVYLDQVLYQQTQENDQSIVHTFKPTIYQSMRANTLRLREYAKQWKAKPSDLSELLDRRMMETASTSVGKLRLKNNLTAESRIRFLKSIGEDETFRNAYTMYKLPLKRRIVLFLLYHRLYKVLDRCVVLI